VFVKQHECTHARRTPCVHCVCVRCRVVNRRSPTQTRSALRLRASCVWITSGLSGSRWRCWRR